MKTEIIKVKGDWTEVLNDCRSTVGKDNLNREPSGAFKMQLLISEHSPIRDISYKWRWNGIKSWIATHFVRHKWECFVKTQRSDRTGIDRDELPQGSKVDFIGEANIQHLIDTSRKRMCHKAHKETREQWEDLIDTIKEYDVNVWTICVPNCIYRFGCPEGQGCGMFYKYLSYCSEHGAKALELTDIEERCVMYKLYYESLKSSEMDD